MSKTIDAFLITRPHLVDVVDDEWMRDTLPDDGTPDYEMYDFYAI